MFDFIPNLFVWIEFWRISWKKEHPNLFPMPQHKLTHLRRAMIGGTIGDDHQWTSPLPHDFLQEFYVLFPGDTPLFDGVMELPGRRDHREDMITPPLGRYRDYWLSITHILNGRAAAPISGGRHR